MVSDLASWSVVVFSCFEQSLTSLQCNLEAWSTLQLLHVSVEQDSDYFSVVCCHYRIASSHSYIHPRIATMTRTKLDEAGLEDFLNDNVKPFVGHHVSSCPFSYRKGHVKANVFCFVQQNESLKVCYCPYEMPPACPILVKKRKSLYSPDPSFAIITNPSAVVRNQNNPGTRFYSVFCLSLALNTVKSDFSVWTTSSFQVQLWNYWCIILISF